MGTFSRLLGERHILYLECMANLAYTYQEQGRMGKAEELYLKVSESRAHPSTVMPQANLATVISPPRKVERSRKA